MRPRSRSIRRSCEARQARRSSIWAISRRSRFRQAGSDRDQCAAVGLDGGDFSAEEGIQGVNAGGVHPSGRSDKLIIPSAVVKRRRRWRGHRPYSSSFFGPMPEIWRSAAASARPRGAIAQQGRVAEHDVGGDGALGRQPLAQRLEPPRTAAVVVCRPRLPTGAAAVVARSAVGARRRDRRRPAAASGSQAARTGRTRCHRRRSSRRGGGRASRWRQPRASASGTCRGPARAGAPAASASARRRERTGRSHHVGPRVEQHAVAVAAPSRPARPISW